MLAFGTPDDVRECCRKIIDGVARDGGYIMDASADHAGRHEGREPAGDDRFHAGIRSVLT